MPGKTSFYYAIFKKLQAVGRAQNAHVNPDSDPAGNYGGFSLLSTDNVHGIFKALGANATDVGLVPGVSKPLKDNSNLAPENPLWKILDASIGPDGALPDKVAVGGAQWPVMPPPYQGSLAQSPLYTEMNGGPGQRKLVDAVGHWISTDGKADDTPKPAPVSFAALSATPVPKFPLKAGESTSPLLFVASFAGDDGRRHDDGALPNPPLNHVPDNFWDTSQIFMTDEAGNVLPADAPLPAGTERYVTAVIGNAGGQGGGRAFNGQPKLEVRCDAQVFNSFMAPGVPLPSLGNLDPADANPLYEQFYLQLWTRDLAGFRFNVDAVFKALADKMAAQGFGPAQLGGISIAEWLKAGHACVKVRIVSGENPNAFTPQGPVPTLTDNPRLDRHVAQRNIGQFDAAVMAAKKIDWKNFIVGQAGKGANVLTLQPALPAGAARFYLAVPKQSYERWIGQGGSKGGGTLRGWEPAERGTNKPFPDAVILQATSAEPHLAVADHAKEPYLAMSLGVGAGPEGDPKRIRGSVSMIHAAAGGMIVGGLTLRRH